jgi:hypothetical protein
MNPGDTESLQLLIAKDVLNKHLNTRSEEDIR